MTDLRQERWDAARRKAEEIARTTGLEDLRQRVNRAKANSEAFRFRLEGRRLLLEEEGSAHDQPGFGRELRQVARELGSDSEGHDRNELFRRSLDAYRQAIRLDGSPDVRRPALVGAAAVYRDLGDYRKCVELCELVLSEDPGNAYARRTRDACP